MARSHKPHHPCNEGEDLDIPFLAGRADKFLNICFAM